MYEYITLHYTITVSYFMSFFFLLFVYLFFIKQIKSNRIGKYYSESSIKWKGGETLKEKKIIVSA